MNDLLGFVVLTGPLFLIVLWLPISLALAVWISRKYIKKKPAIKLVGVVGIFLVVLLLPVSDEIAGRIYFNHLCGTEAGVKVYQTIELPADYWDEDGRPKFYVNRYDGNKLRFIFQDKRMKEYPEFIYTWTPTRNKLPFHIERDILQISMRSSGAVLGEYDLFRHWGGWVKRNFSPHNSANGCAIDDLNGWELKVFKPEAVSDSKGDEK